MSEHDELVKKIVQYIDERSDKLAKQKLTCMVFALIGFGLFLSFFLVFIWEVFK